MTIEEQEQAWYEDALEMEIQDHEEAIGETRSRLTTIKQMEIKDGSSDDCKKGKF